MSAQSCASEWGGEVVQDCGWQMAQGSLRLWDEMTAFALPRRCRPSMAVVEACWIRALKLYATLSCEFWSDSSFNDGYTVHIAKTSELGLKLMDRR